MNKFLAIDLGTKYIGLALCHGFNIAIECLPHINAFNKKKNLINILSIIIKYNTNIIIIGIPSKNSIIYKYALSYFSSLTLILPKGYKTILHDESFSSISRKVIKKKNSISPHSVAAKTILESFMAQKKTYE